MTDSMELYYAEMEAARNDAERAYFSARQSLEGTVETELYHALFKAGFERGFERLWKERSGHRDTPEPRNG